MDLGTLLNYWPDPMDTAATQRGTRDQIDAYQVLLREGATLFAGDREPSLEQFRAFAGRLNLTKPSPGSRAGALQSSETRYAGILGVGWIRREGATGKFAPVAQSAGNIPAIVLDEGSPERYRFVYLEPPEWRSQVEAGNDMFSDPKSRAAMQRARDSGRPALSSP